MSDVLVICGHPNYAHSVANKALLQEFRTLMPHAEINILGETYPDFKIDVQKEQERLKDVKFLIFQYPLWWYAAPSLMHQYIEQVFTYGFAYGSTGHALKGKNLVVSFTIGGAQEDYQRRSGLMHTVEQFLPAMLETAAYTGMVYRGSLYSFGMLVVDVTDAARVAEVQAKAKDQAHRLVKHLAQFQ